MSISAHLPSKKNIPTWTSSIMPQSSKVKIDGVGQRTVTNKKLDRKRSTFNVGEVYKERTDPTSISNSSKIIEKTITTNSTQSTTKKVAHCSVMIKSKDPSSPPSPVQRSESMPNTLNKVLTDLVSFEPTHLEIIQQLASITQVLKACKQNGHNFPLTKERGKALVSIKPDPSKKPDPSSLKDLSGPQKLTNTIKVAVLESIKSSDNKVFPNDHEDTITYISGVLLHAIRVLNITHVRVTDKEIIQIEHLFNQILQLPEIQEQVKAVQKERETPYALFVLKKTWEISDACNGVRFPKIASLNTVQEPLEPNVIWDMIIDGNIELQNLMIRTHRADPLTKEMVSELITKFKEILIDYRLRSEDLRLQKLQRILRFFTKYCKNSLDLPCNPTDQEELHKMFKTLINTIKLQRMDIQTGLEEAFQEFQMALKPTTPPIVPPKNKDIHQAIVNLLKVYSISSNALPESLETYAQNLNKPYKNITSGIQSKHRALEICLDLLKRAKLLNLDKYVQPLTETLKIIITQEEAGYKLCRTKYKFPLADNIFDSSHFKTNLYDNLCCLMQTAFKDIKLGEFDNSCWTKENKELTAPNVTKFTKQFNAISNFLVFHLLFNSHLDQNVKFLLEIATKAIQNRQFQVAMVISSALNNGAVSRLSYLKLIKGETHAKKPDAEYKAIEEILTRGKNNYKLYRERVNRPSHHLPTLPYLGIHLTDITFWREGQPAGLEKVNMNYLSALYKEKNFIASCQQSLPSCNLLNAKFKMVIDLFEIWSESLSVEYFYQLSYKIEPKKT